MSSSQFVASLRINGSTFFFARARTAQGRVPDVPVMEEEELKDAGIDGVRFRQIYLQFEDFDMETVEDWTTRDAGDLLEQKYKGAVSFVGELTTVFGGVTKKYKEVKVRAVRCDVRPGVLTGFGATTGNIGTVAAVWMLKIMKVS